MNTFETMQCTVYSNLLLDNRNMNDGTNALENLYLTTRFIEHGVVVMHIFTEQVSYSIYMYCLRTGPTVVQLLPRL